MMIVAGHPIINRWEHAMAKHLNATQANMQCCAGSGEPFATRCTYTRSLSCLTPQLSPLPQLGSEGPCPWSCLAICLLACDCAPRLNRSRVCRRGRVCLDVVPNGDMWRHLRQGGPASARECVSSSCLRLGIYAALGPGTLSDSAMSEASASGRSPPMAPPMPVPPAGGKAGDGGARQRARCLRGHHGGQRSALAAALPLASSDRGLVGLSPTRRDGPFFGDIP